MSKTYCILVAEDDDGHFTLIKRHLDRLGFHNNILRFSDGQEILDYFAGTDESFAFDPLKSYLAILDIRMPKISGIEVLEYMKSKDPLKHIPVVMLTSSDDTYEIAKCLMLGCDDYILKPTDFAGFSHSMQKVGESLLSSIVDIIDISGRDSGT